MGAGQWAAAAELAAQLFGRDGGSDQSLTLRLSALLRAGKGGEAVALAQRHEPRFGPGVKRWLADLDDFGPLQELAGRLLLRGDAAGLWVFEAQAATWPGNAGVLANLALAYRHVGRLADAETTYGRALRAEPAAWLFNDLGLLHKGQGRHGPAVEAFLSGLRREEQPGDSAAGTNLGLLFQRTGRTRGRDPVLDLQRVLRRRPDAALARRLLLDVLDSERRPAPR